MYMQANILCFLFTRGYYFLDYQVALYIYLDFMDELWSCINYDQLCDLEQLNLQALCLSVLIC